MQRTIDYCFATEEGKKYFEWLDSLSNGTFHNVFVEEWEKLLKLFGKEHIIKKTNINNEQKEDKDRIWN